MVVVTPRELVRTTAVVRATEMLGSVVFNAAVTELFWMTVSARSVIFHSTPTPSNVQNATRAAMVRPA